jgi:NADH dehydrogenase
MDVTIIQGSDKLLKELDPHVSDLAMKRLSQPQVTFAFGGHIKEVTEKEVRVDNGKSYPFDILIWTGGVEPNKIPATSGLPVDKHGAVIVNESLQVQGFENIFAAGDIAGFIDPKTQKPVPNVAQVAEEQGHAAGENIVRLLENKPLRPYKFRHFGFVVPLRGRYATAELMGGWHFDGLLGWGLQQLVLLRYFLGILPLHKALMKWNRFEMDLKQ